MQLLFLFHHLVQDIYLKAIRKVHSTKTLVIQLKLMSWAMTYKITFYAKLFMVGKWWRMKWFTSIMILYLQKSIPLTCAFLGNSGGVKVGGGWWSSVTIKCSRIRLRRIFLTLNQLKSTFHLIPAVDHKCSLFPKNASVTFHCCCYTTTSIRCNVGIHNAVLYNAFQKLFHAISSCSAY